MLQTETIRQEVMVALLKAPSSAPSVIEALLTLGVKKNVIAAHLGVHPSMVTHWCSRSEPVAARHHPTLLDLLRTAHGEAVKTLGAVAAKANPPEVECSFAVYRHVWRSGEILRELEHREVPEP